MCTRVWTVLVRIIYKFTLLWLCFTPLCWCRWLQPVILFKWLVHAVGLHLTQNRTGDSTAACDKIPDLTIMLEFEKLVDQLTLRSWTTEEDTIMAQQLHSLKHERTSLQIGSDKRRWPTSRLSRSYSKYSLLNWLWGIRTEPKITCFNLVFSFYSL